VAGIALVGAQFIASAWEVYFGVCSVCLNALASCRDATNCASSGHEVRSILIHPNPSSDTPLVGCRALIYLLVYIKTG
jgi:hypothetical protein